MFRSANHIHPFTRLNRDNGWKCNGSNLFGKCKSNFDEYHKSYGHARYRCTVCIDFDLCQRCLDAPNIQDTVPIIDSFNHRKFVSQNHQHPFIKLNKDNGWKCNGSHLFGKCKSNFDEYYKSYGHARYRCTVCTDFDLCELCLLAPKTYNNDEIKYNNGLFPPAVVKPPVVNPNFVIPPPNFVIPSAKKTKSIDKNKKLQEIFCCVCFESIKDVQQSHLKNRTEHGIYCNKCAAYFNNSSTNKKFNNVFNGSDGSCRETVTTTKSIPSSKETKTQNIYRNTEIQEILCSWCFETIKDVPLSDLLNRTEAEIYCSECEAYLHGSIENTKLSSVHESDSNYKTTNTIDSKPSSNAMKTESLNTTDQQKEKVCCICMENKIEVSLIHIQNNTGHQICCNKCATDLKKKNMKCPVCRENIDLIIKNFIV